MEVYLIRHGIAVERSPNLQDELRPLTQIGREKTGKVARKLGNLGVKFDLILTSPLVRAKETAEILRDAGLSREIVEFSALAPNGDLKDWLNWCLESRYNKTINYLAMVGHQPDLGYWAEKLLWGKSQEKLVIKKAGVVGLKLADEQTPIGNSELFLLTSPKWFV